VIDMPTQEFLNVREAARELNVHENTVRNLEKRGQLKAIRLPGSGFRRFRKEDIERMRGEMWSQFAPDTAMPETSRRPSRRATLNEDDYEN
jgi:excisionase family DNA binding protein